MKTGWQILKIWYSDEGSEEGEVKDECSFMGAEQFVNLELVL